MAESINYELIPTARSPHEFQTMFEAAAVGAYIRYHVGERAGSSLLGQMARAYWNQGRVYLVAKRLHGIMSFFVVKREASAEGNRTQDGAPDSISALTGRRMALSSDAD